MPDVPTCATLTPCVCELSLGQNNITHSLSDLSSLTAILQLCFAKPIKASDSVANRFHVHIVLHNIHCSLQNVFKYGIIKYELHCGMTGQTSMNVNIIGSSSTDVEVVLHEHRNGLSH